MSFRMTTVILLSVLMVALMSDQVAAFGAGNIPSYSYLEGKAFRHGDIADTLATVLKKSGGFLGRGSKFRGLDIQRIYFGNWLRDYSQAMDIAALSKINKQTILNLIMVLGFMAHGYATGEFEITDERLGVYLCTEHIDNPKGYAADQPNGDARPFDPRLRPPVQPIELEIDPRTGMKNYIANESGSWDTSARLLRTRIRECIAKGRENRATGSDDALHDAYRILGCLLHTLEDFPAHSNFVELCLRRLGHTQVFCHVGDQVLIDTPNGRAPPLVTGTFAGVDFLHSLLGEATDHISQNAVSSLNTKGDAKKGRNGAARGIVAENTGLDDGEASLPLLNAQFAAARAADRTTSDSVRDMLVSVPGSGAGEMTRDVRDIEDIRYRTSTTDTAQMSPQEVYATAWKVLTIRDNFCKAIARTIEKIPGLSSLIDKLTDSINRLVFVTLEPLLKPIMVQATGALQTGSSTVLDADQYRVFDDPTASDPTHSFLSKDHFVLILNEPAGQLATIIIKHAVQLIVAAWDDSSIHPDQTVDRILEVFHHPYFNNPNSAIQNEMGAFTKTWLAAQSAADRQYILNGLSKTSVRNGKNKRRGHESEQVGHGCGGSYNSILSPDKVSNFAQQHIPGASGVINTYNSVSGTFNSAQNQYHQYTGREGEAGFVPDANAAAPVGTSYAAMAGAPPQDTYAPPSVQAQGYAPTYAPTHGSHEQSQAQYVQAPNQSYSQQGDQSYLQQGQQQDYAQQYDQGYAQQGQFPPQQYGNQGYPGQQYNPPPGYMPPPGQYGFPPGPPGPQPGGYYPPPGSGYY